MCEQVKQSDWDRCVAFHGHVCGGLMIGYQAARYAIELLALTFSEDENIVCVSENDACGVDAIQVMLGCSIGKGNLLFHIRGKQAFSFYERSSGKSVRLVLRPSSDGMNRKSTLRYLSETPPFLLFDVKPTTIEIPSRAKIFESYVCDCCGEETGSKWIRLQGEKKLCLDCCGQYDRFHV